MQHVESARPERELARLDVHEDVVALLDRPGHVQVRDARRAVDLDPREPTNAPHGWPSCSAPKRDQHRMQGRSTPA